MKNKIALTQNEFDLILRENHPEYDSCNSRNRWIENGSGCDVVFERDVIRESDKAVLVISFIENSSIGDYQDWIHDSDCDFYIDENKKDIYDSRGQIIKESPVVEPEIKEKTNEEIYNEMKERGEIPDIKDLSWLDVDTDTLVELVKMTIESFDPKTEVRHYHVGRRVFELAIKQKLNADRLWGEVFQNVKLHKISEKRIREFFEHRKSLRKDNTITVVINGVKTKISKTDANKIAKTMKDLDNFTKMKK